MSADSGPDVIIIAGPNGAGKTTASEDLLNRELAIREFVNADWIAKGLSGFEPETAAIAAGRVMLGRLRELSEENASFAFETTLASRTFARWIQELRVRGYRSRLIYLWVSDPALCLERVRTRVRLGGHHVPDDVVMRRYELGLRNLFRLYLPVVDEWELYDNSRAGWRQLIACGSRSGVEQFAAAGRWLELKAKYGVAGN